uniref:Uncharacterized protein n=1 Tax=Percolomonas cosmopolitus TaxID=63605 RepID=A0A7S1KSD3_9EUKA
MSPAAIVITSHYISPQSDKSHHPQFHFLASQEDPNTEANLPKNGYSSTSPLHPSFMMPQEAFSSRVASVPPPHPYATAVPSSIITTKKRKRPMKVTQGTFGSSLHHCHNQGLDNQTYFSSTTTSTSDFHANSAKVSSSNHDHSFHREKMDALSLATMSSSSSSENVGSSARTRRHSSPRVRSSLSSRRGSFSADRRLSFMGNGISEGLASFSGLSYVHHTTQAHDALQEQQPLMMCSGVTIQPIRSHLKSKRTVVQIEYPTPRSRSRPGSKERSKRRRSQSTIGSSRKLARALSISSSDSNTEGSLSSTSSSEHVDSRTNSSRTTKSSSSAKKNKRKQKKKRSQSVGRQCRQASSKAISSPVKFLTPVRKERKDLKTFLHASGSNGTATEQKRREAPLGAPHNRKRLVTIKRDAAKDAASVGSGSADESPSDTQYKQYAGRSSSPTIVQKRRPLQPLNTNTETSSAADKPTRRITSTSKKSVKVAQQATNSSTRPHKSSTVAANSLLTDADISDLHKQKKREEFEKEKLRKDVLRRQIYAQNRLMRFVAVHQWKSVLMLEEDFDNHFSGQGSASAQVGAMNHAV